MTPKATPPKRTTGFAPTSSLATSAKPAPPPGFDLAHKVDFEHDEEDDSGPYSSF